MPVFEAPSFTGSRNGPDNVARAKTSWQAALRQQAREDLAELQAIRELLVEGCPPACDACRLGIHDDSEEVCRCCGHREQED